VKTYLQLLWTNPAACRKAFVAIIGALLQVALMLFPQAAWLPVAVAVATALGIYHVRNAPVHKKKEMLYR
jgi:hypothetical protein